MFVRYFCGLESGMGMPTTKSSWSAGDTLYFRIFHKIASGGTSTMVHSSSNYNLTVTEVVR